MEIETFTGKTGKEHQEIMEQGRDFIVIVLDDKNETKIAISDIPENKIAIEELINSIPNILEWTRVRAWNANTAKVNAYAAHAQFYDKLNGLENWIESAVLGIQSL